MAVTQPKRNRTLTQSVGRGLLKVLSSWKCKRIKRSRNLRLPWIHEFLLTLSSIDYRPYTYVSYILYMLSILFVRLIRHLPHLIGQVRPQISRGNPLQRSYKAAALSDLWSARVRTTEQRLPVKEASAKPLTSIYAYLTVSYWKSKAASVPIFLI